ncbi:MAG TPA: hypothetical protein VH682_31325 [Gemmataceae bacterium]|jgi:hypothetical protein
MTFHATEHEPTLLTPQELLLSRLPGLLSLWKHDRDRGTDAYRTAQDLVAAWSGLQRLVLPQGPSEALCRVDEIIHDDMALFLEAILSHDFDHESWLREMEKLDTDWDLGCEEAEELEWRTHEAFDALDRTELFAWFAATKVPSDPRIEAWLESLPGRCGEAERFMAERPDLFLCLATDLAAVIASSRPGLEETDPRLWETLGKHHRIEEARDEVELTPSRYAVLAGVLGGVTLVRAKDILPFNAVIGQKNPPLGHRNPLRRGKIAWTRPEFPGDHDEDLFIQMEVIDEQPDPSEYSDEVAEMEGELLGRPA